MIVLLIVYECMCVRCVSIRLTIVGTIKAAVLLVNGDRALVNGDRAVLVNLLEAIG